MLKAQSSMRQISYSLRDETIGWTFLARLSWVAVMVFCLLEHAGLLGAQKLWDLFPSVTISLLTSLKLYPSPAEISLSLLLSVSLLFSFMPQSFRKWLIKFHGHVPATQKSPAKTSQGIWPPETRFQIVGSVCLFTAKDVGSNWMSPLTIIDSILV